MNTALPFLPIREQLLSVLQNSPSNSFTTYPAFHQRSYVLDARWAKSTALFYRMMPRFFALLGVLLEYVAQPKKKSKQGGAETYEESTSRYSSPKSWIVAVIPVPEAFAPLPSREELGMNIDAKWGLPECMRELTPHTTPLRILSLAEVGNTASADHLLQMATMPLEHKTTALGIPYSCPVSYQFDGALQQSLFSLFALLVTGDTPRYCPLATETGMKLCVAARIDSAHIMSVAISLATALQTGRSTLAIAGVFGAGKTRSLTLSMASHDY